MLSPEYLAGLFDGEGSVFITNELALRTNIVNTSYPVMKEIYDQFQGSLYDRGYAWMASWTRNACLPILTYIHPYLIIKRERVDMALSYQNIASARSGCKGMENREEREWFRSELNGLNGTQYGRPWR